MPDSPSLTLYYAPGVCSLAPHIVLHELAQPFSLVRADIRAHVLPDGSSLHDVTPKDYVPALALPDGSVLTETAIILLYLADLRPALALAPPPSERLRFHELLHFIATELHKGFAPFTIMANPSEDSRRWAAARLTARVAVLEAALGDRAFFHGDGFTVLDAYAYWALASYVRLVKAELPSRLRAYVDRIAARPSVLAARRAEQ